MKYLVIEIQTNADGTVGTLVSSYDNRDEAESKYHAVLSSAYLSHLPSHAAIMITSEGRAIPNRSEVHHYIEAEPEEE